MHGVVRGILNVDVAISRSLVCAQFPMRSSAVDIPVCMIVMHQGYVVESVYV